MRYIMNDYKITLNGQQHIINKLLIIENEDCSAYNICDIVGLSQGAPVLSSGLYKYGHKSKYNFIVTYADKNIQSKQYDNINISCITDINSFYSEYKYDILFKNCTGLIDINMNYYSYQKIAHLFGNIYIEQLYELTEICHAHYLQLYSKFKKIYTDHKIHNPCDKTTMILDNIHNLYVNGCIIETYEYIDKITLYSLIPHSEKLLNRVLINYKCQVEIDDGIMIMKERLEKLDDDINKTDDMLNTFLTILCDT